MEELGSTADSHDNNRYDNDFEKLSHYEEEASSTAEAAAAASSPGGDAKDAELAATGDETTPFASKSQLNIAEPPVTQPRPPPSDVAADEGSVCSGCCFMTKTIDPRVKELLLWRDAKKSSTVFTISLVVLLSLALCSIISVISYISLAVLTMTASLRIYYLVMAAVKKTDPVNPFKEYLEMDIKLSDDKTSQYGDIVAKHITKAADSFRRVIFVDNLVATLKFAVVMWVLTYIGGWFNGMTLLIIGDILLFTLPKVYDMYQSQIDSAAKMICGKLQDVWKQVEDKLPMLGRKKQD